MAFRLRAFGIHLLISAGVLTFVLGALYLGWYRWPGWYVAGVSGVVGTLVCVDLTIGPLFTLIVAQSTKPRRELARDITIIAAVQVAALIYGPFPCGWADRCTTLLRKCPAARSSLRHRSSGDRRGTRSELRLPAALVQLAPMDLGTLPQIRMKGAKSWQPH